MVVDHLFVVGIAYWEACVGCNLVGWVVGVP